MRANILNIGEITMEIHCVRVKQIRNGLYKLCVNGMVEVQGYSYPVESGTIVAPSDENVTITDPSGNQYIWTFISRKSEWKLNLLTQRVVLQKFDGAMANVLLSKDEKIGICHKTVVVMRYKNLLYDLPWQIRNYIKTVA